MRSGGWRRRWPWHGRPASRPWAAALTSLGRQAVVVAAPEAADICDEAVAAARRVGDPILVAGALLIMAGACERAGAWGAPAFSQGRRCRSAARVIPTVRHRRWPSRAGTTSSTGGWTPRKSAWARRSSCVAATATTDVVEPLIDHAWLMVVRRSDEPAARGFLDCLGLAPRRRPVQPG